MISFLTDTFWWRVSTCYRTHLLNYSPKTVAITLATHYLGVLGSSRVCSGRYSNTCWRPFSRKAMISFMASPSYLQRRTTINNETSKNERHLRATIGEWADLLGNVDGFHHLGRYHLFFAVDQVLQKINSHVVVRRQEHGDVASKEVVYLSLAVVFRRELLRRDLR